MIFFKQKKRYFNIYFKQRLRDLLYKLIKGFSLREAADNDISVVTSEEASKIIDIREPRGMFYVPDKNNIGKKVYIGIDNRTGDAWVEEFYRLSKCKRWLRGNQ